MTAAGSRGLLIRVTARDYEKLRKLAVIYSVRDEDDADAKPWTARDVAGVQLSIALSETTQDDVLAELGDARLTRANVRAAVSRAADKVE